MVGAITDAPAPHMLLSRKTLKNMGGVINEGAAVEGAHGDFGARMLAKFGWKKGDGLGKRNDGITSHIRVTKRAEGLGLGASEKPERSEWALPPVGAGASSDSESADEEEARVRAQISSSGVLPGLADEDLFQLCGGARLGMRARADQGGKQARMEAADRALLEKLRGTGTGTGTSTGAPATVFDAPALKVAPEDLMAEARAKRKCDAEPIGDASQDKAARKAAKRAAKAEQKAAQKAAEMAALERAARKAAKKAAKKEARKARE
jgi:hypothetical protein